MLLPRHKYNFQGPLRRAFEINRSRLSRCTWSGRWRRSWWRALPVAVYVKLSIGSPRLGSGVFDSKRFSGSSGIRRGLAVVMLPRAGDCRPASIGRVSVSAPSGRVVEVSSFKNVEDGRGGMPVGVGGAVGLPLLS